MKKPLLWLAVSSLLIAVVIASGYANDISYTYDQLHRLIKVVYADGTTIEYGYDGLGNRVTLSVTKSSDLKADFTAAPHKRPGAPGGRLQRSIHRFDHLLVLGFRGWWKQHEPKSDPHIQRRGYLYGDLDRLGRNTIIITIGNDNREFGRPHGKLQRFAKPVEPPHSVSSLPTPRPGPSQVGPGVLVMEVGARVKIRSTGTPAPGTYRVSLTVTGTGGTSGPVSETITVNPIPPAADFSASPGSGTAPLTVSFTNNSTGIITSWLWTFGDGTTSGSENPVHYLLQPRDLLGNPYCRRPKRILKFKKHFHHGRSGYRADSEHHRNPN